MKRKKLFYGLIVAVIALFVGSMAAQATGIIDLPVSGKAFAHNGIVPTLGMATVYREVWSKEVIKQFQQGLKDTFLDGIKDFSVYVTGDDEAQVIHASYFGVEPDVLINNSTYPIAIQELNGSDITISLDKYQTKATPVTDDELYALAYDKMGLVKESHGNAILKNRLKKSIHAFGPAGHTTDTPVILTTGAIVNGRKRMIWADIVNFRQSLSDAGIDIEDYRLVLCDDHVNDLLLEENSDFKKNYSNFQNGTITSQLGFDIRQFSQTPYYNATTKAKLSFGALPASTDVRASVAFPITKTGKASGKTFTYYSEAKTDPLNQRNLINFRNYFIALPLVTKGFGAIISAKV